MKLNELISELLQVQNGEDVLYNPEVVVMQDVTLPPHLPIQGERQSESNLFEITKIGGRLVLRGKRVDY